MNRLRILHAADLHLDSPFEALAEEKAALRRAEQRRLLEMIAETAVTEGADIILLAGDLLDSDSAYTETAETLLRAFSGITIPVFIAPGNHDFYSARSPYARLELPENVHIFKTEELQCVTLPEKSARVWGCAFTDKFNRGPLAGFSYENPDGVLDIMVVHGDAENASSPNGPISQDELARCGMDYVALGHIHTYSGKLRAGKTVYAWPGCPEGRGFDETGEKGVILADVSDSGVSIRFTPMPGRRYEILTVDAGGDRDVFEAVRQALPAGTQDDIYRILLTGERAAPPETAELYRELSGRFFQLQLRDMTAISRDVWEKAGEDTLRGRFLSRLRTRHDAAQSDDERALIVMAARMGLRALDNGEDPK